MRRLAEELDIIPDAERRGWEWLKADEALAAYLIENPDPPQDDTLAAGLLEGRVREVWRLAAVAAAFLTGGKARAKGFGMADQDPAQHALGFAVEAEHVNPEAREEVQAIIRGRISRDHEAEKVPGGYYYRAKGGEAKVKGEPE